MRNCFKFNIFLTVPYREFLKYRFLFLRFLVFILFFSIVNTFFIESYRVKGDSMFPTLMSGDLLIVDKWNVNYERGDVVIFLKNGDFYVKRIWGLPGDKISVTNENKIYLNDSSLLHEFDEPILQSNFNVTVNDNLYFVLGDNINDSIDSRHFGLVRENEIVGKVFLRYFPFQNFNVF